MRRMLAVVILAAGLTRMAAAQDSDEHARARDAADLARGTCAERLLGMTGVRSVSVFGIGSSFRVLVSVLNNETIAKVRALVGETMGDTKIMVVVWTPPAPPPAPRTPGQTVVSEPKPADPKRADAPPAKDAPRKDQPTLPDPNYKGLPDCDIILEHYGVKPPSRWKEGYKCQYIRRSVLPVDGHGGWTYDYTKHRPCCPVLNGRAAMPADCDNFVKWVFTKGFTEVQRGATFLDGFDVRGTDRWWARDAEADLRSRLPYIRAFADWNRPAMNSRGFKAQQNAGMTPTPGWGMQWVPPSEWSGPSTPTGPPPTPTPGSGGGSFRGGGGCTRGG